MKTVDIVSAGSGGWHTLGLGAARALAEADVIYYDQLMESSILCLAQPSCQFVDVGKRAGAHSAAQQDICEAMVASAREGKKVLRLKGGDANLFGRLTEEVEALKAAGVPFRVLSGTTSASVAASEIGFSLTSRRRARGLTFCTTSSADGTYEPAWQALAQLDHTLVFYMSLKDLPTLAQKLMAHGKEADCPLLLASDVGMPSQRWIKGTLGKAVQTQEAGNITAPALIFVGEGLNLIVEPKALPLAGLCFYLPQLSRRADALAQPLRALGGVVYQWPVVEERALEPTFWPKKEEALFFSSPSAVEAFVASMPQDSDLRDLRGAFFAPGASTLKKLRAFGLRGEVVDEAHLPSPICFIGNLQNSAYQRAKERGLEARLLALFAQKPGLLPSFLTEALQQRVQYVLFTSAFQVEAFCAQSEARPLALCIGPKTAARATERGFETKVAATPTFEGLVALACQEAGERRSS